MGLRYLREQTIGVTPFFAVTLNLTLNHETLDRVNLDLNLYQRALDGESVSLSRESRALG